MRIGIDSRLPYYQRGGISQYVIQLVNAIAGIDDKHEFLILQSRKDRSNYAPNQAANFRRQDLWTPCHHRLERWTLSLELLTQDLDLLHSPDFIPPAFGARQRVITVHDLNFLYYPEFLTAESRRYYVDQIAWAVETADHIFADSAATKKDLEEQLAVPADKVTTVHLAASPIFTQQYSEGDIKETLAQFGLRSGFVLFVGTLSPRKNVGLLVRVYARLVREAGIVEPLVLVGGRGWLSEGIFEAISANDLEGRVRHLTDVSDRQLAHLYHKAGVLALPSWYEGFGLPALEAMHAGCAVVASNRASLPEVVGTAGILLDPADEDGWYMALKRVLQNPALRQSLQDSGPLQATRFSWQKTASSVLSVYEALR